MAERKDMGQETGDKGKRKDTGQGTGDMRRKGKGHENKDERGVIVLPDEVRRYLEKYGQKTIDQRRTTKDKQRTWILEYNDGSNVKMAVVIPAIMEYENIKKLLLSLAANDAAYFKYVLVIFVINNLESSAERIRRDNACSIGLLRSIINGQGEVNCNDTFGIRGSNDEISEEDMASDENIIKTVISSGLRFALVDASSEGLELPEKDGGVGLARKIGMDLALTVFDYGSDFKNILVCLDGDCTVDINYITEIYRNFQDRKLSAAAVNFRHETAFIYDDEYSYAITCYEIFLRYYVLGLTYAESPYAFHTIGSTMACDHISYIKAEGMNKRKAAEDFYFMEKLAKIVPVQKINSTSVYPSSRGSWRVPFGTGQRVNRYLSHMQDEYLLYSPGSFTVLKQWLKIYLNSEIFDPAHYLNEAEKIHPALADFLKSQNFERDYGRILLNAKKAGQLLKQKSGWFDGFRTLKLIHYLRDNGFPPVPMFDALDEMLNLTGYDVHFNRPEDKIPSLEIQLNYLDLLRRIS